MPVQVPQDLLSGAQGHFGLGVLTAGVAHDDALPLSRTVRLDHPARVSCNKTPNILPTKMGRPIPLVPRLLALPPWKKGLSLPADSMEGPRRAPDSQSFVQSESTGVPLDLGRTSEVLFLLDIKLQVHRQISVFLVQF